jgi:hypothetical protein
MVHLACDFVNFCFQVLPLPSSCARDFEAPNLSNFALYMPGPSLCVLWELIQIGAADPEAPWCHGYSNGCSRRYSHVSYIILAYFGRFQMHPILKEHTYALSGTLASASKVLGGVGWGWNLQSHGTSYLTIPEPQVSSALLRKVLFEINHSKQSTVKLLSIACISCGFARIP